MKISFVILSLIYLSITIFVVFGYQPSKFELFCAYTICTITFFTQAIEGDSQ